MQDATAMAQEETIQHSWQKTSLFLQHSLLRVAETSAPLSPRSAKSRAGCCGAMTAKQGMSQRPLEAKQHSRSRNRDRKIDIPEPA